MRYPFAIFDFDGTIADTRKPITLSANHALKELGYATREHDEIQALVGLPLAQVLTTLAGEDDRADELCATYRAIFGSFAKDNSPLFDGAREALHALHDAGVTLAVTTSRSLSSLAKFLEQHDLGSFFSVLAGGDSVEKGKPHPEMLELVMGKAGFDADASLMIGDTTHDMEMGHAAGMHTCAVSYGNHTRDRLATSGPTYFADHADAIPGFVLSARSG